MTKLQNFTGPIIIIGYGSIGRGVLALLEQTCEFSAEQLTIIEPNPAQLTRGTGSHYRHIQVALTPENYSSVLDEIVTATNEQSLIINLSVEVSSVDIMRYAHDRNALYIDTVVEPWPGVYDDFTRPAASRTNFFLREEMLSLKKEFGQTGPTAVSCCGANPGMVSWLTKRALLTLANDTNTPHTTPTTQIQWAQLAKDLGVCGIHIAERDNQISTSRRERDVFVNTWSVDGLISEALQPAELGWGTHEQNLPVDGYTHEQPNACGIFLKTAGAETKVKTWVPGHGPIEAFLVTHNEALSLSDYLTATDESGVTYRPTVHYAYHPCDETVRCLTQLIDEGASSFSEHHVLTEDEIKTGGDELGVLLYGHNKNAYWYGSRLTHAEVPSLAPHQNATGLQVTSAVLAGIFWALQNRTAGIVEVEELDHEFCLNIQEPYLGKVFGEYTQWQPVPNENKTLPEVWQFENIRITNPNN